MVWRRYYQNRPADLPRVNLWAGGFPCQDISVSGRQRGLAGERSSLFFEIIRLLKGTKTEDRPEWLVLENVKNLLSVNRGWDFAAVLNSLAEIGYHIEYGLLNSRFHGVPQTGNESTLSLIDILSRRWTKNISCHRRRRQGSYTVNRWHTG